MTHCDEEENDTARTLSPRRAMHVSASGVGCVEFEASRANKHTRPSAPAAQTTGSDACAARQVIPAALPSEPKKLLSPPPVSVSAWALLWLLLWLFSVIGTESSVPSSQPAMTARPEGSHATAATPEYVGREYAEMGDVSC